MSHVRRARLSGLAVALLLAGCAHLGSGSYIDPGRRGPHPPSTVLPEVAPRPLHIEVPDLPPPSSPTGKEPGSEGPYRGLSPQECLRLSAGESSLGNLLDLKARDCGRGGHARGDCPRPPSPDEHAAGAGSGDLRAEILHTAAIEARAQAAAVGLELYFRLAQAEGQAAGVREALAQVDAALRERDRIEARGLVIPGELDALRQRRIDLLAGLAEADRATEQLSIELRHRLNLGPDPGAWRVWPLVDLDVVPQEPDPDVAVREGLANRPELILARKLDRTQPPEVLRSMLAVLGSVNPLLGLDCEPPAAHSRLAVLKAALGKTEPDPASLLAIRKQWDAYRREREREIAKEIRLAALDVRASAREIAIARERVSYWQAEIDQQRAREAQGLPSYAERVNAELKRIEAGSTLWGKVVAWHVAMVKLRRAQGLLLR